MLACYFLVVRMAQEDAHKAAEVFTILLGEDVRERRDFIMAQARAVRNLDV